MRMAAAAVAAWLCGVKDVASGLSVGKVLPVSGVAECIVVSQGWYQKKV